MQLSSTLKAVALGLSLAIGPAGALAQDREEVNLVHALPQLSPSFAIASSLPAHLGFWEEEGLDVEVNTTPGSAAAIQLVLGRQADIAYGNPLTAMITRQKGGNLVFYYTSLRGDIFGIALPAGKGLESLEDLRGKTIGVSSFASGGTPYARSLLATVGLEEGRDYNLVEIGVGGRAAAALQGGEVHALSLWDEAYRQMELAGIEFAQVIKDPRAKDHIAGSLSVNEEDLENRRDVLIGVARGIAKAQLFQEVNPEASVLIHWKVYPQSMPRGGQTEEEVKKAANVVSVRRHIQSEEAMGTGRYGDVPAENMESFQQYLKDTGQLEELIDVSRYYTNDMIAEINDFDRQAIIDMAKNYKLD